MPTAFENSGNNSSKKPTQQTPLSTKFRRISVVDKMFFVQNTAILIQAGFSLSKALQTIKKQTKTQWFGEVIAEVANEVESGKTFAESLRKFEKLFDPLFINMIEAGEMSGKLEGTLKAIRTQLNKSHILFLKVRNALAYPVIILIAMLGIGTAMMIFVIPNIVELYRDDADTLPLITKLVIVFSDFIRFNGLLSLFIVIGIAFILWLLYRQKQIQLHVQRMVLKFPVAGQIIQEFNIAQFCRIFHSLITTDIPIVRSLSIIVNTINNPVYKTYLNSIIADVEKGKSIGVLLSKDPLLFPPTVVEMIIVAEESGALEEMTNNIATHYEEEVSASLDGLSVLIEPILMIVLGVSVGIIAIAVLWPMYNLVNVI